MSEQIQALSGTGDGTTVGTRVNPRRWRAIQSVWAVLAVLLLALTFAAIPQRFENAARGWAVQHPAASSGDGLSQEFYALYEGALLPTFVTLAFFTVALVILRRRPQDRMALFSSFTLLLFGGAAVTGTMYDLAAAHPMLWFPLSFLAYLGQVSFATFFYLFPDGRFLPRWTRWIALAVAVLFLPASFFPDSPYNVFNGPLFFVFIGSLIFVQAYRYTRLSNSLQRQQTKWVVFGSAAALAGFAVVLAVGSVAQELTHPGAGELVLLTLLFGFILLIPFSIGVAVLRHRLWEIDPVINRTLVYGVLTVGVVIIYVLAVTYLGALFQAGGNLAISVVVTGIIAVLFAPARERVQRVVNKLMYGERDDPYAVISRLGKRLEGTLSPDAVLPVITRTVRDALKLPYVAIALNTGSGAAITAESGLPVNGPLLLPLLHRGENIGSLILAPRQPGEKFSPNDRRLLDDLARQAGVAAHAVRLTADLQRSRERLVTTREEERRRLRRDLHDGLGPMLASLALKLDIADEAMDSDPARARRVIQGLKTESRAAVTDIRRLVYDLRPPALDDLGLVGAVQETAAQCGTGGLPVVVRAPAGLPPLPAAVEVAAYRIIQEALTNTMRHAAASSCTVNIATRDVDGGLIVEVVDDGKGVGQLAKPGVGVASMRERAAEIGGACIVESVNPDGSGTRVRALLPGPGLQE